MTFIFYKMQSIEPTKITFMIIIIQYHLLKPSGSPLECPDLHRKGSAYIIGINSIKNAWKWHSDAFMKVLVNYTRLGRLSRNSHCRGRFCLSNPIILLTEKLVSFICLSFLSLMMDASALSSLFAIVPFLTN